MKHGSLFSGIGGFELAASWMNWDNVFNCELEPFCRKVLNYHFPNSIQHEDIRATDFSIYRGKIDLLTMGVPCQPYSLSGERKGTEDPRHLWPEAYRSVREIQPAFVVFENVYGLVNWEGGVVFDEVQADLEAEGYQIAPFLLPAYAVNGQNRRDRIWFIGHLSDSRYIRCNSVDQTEKGQQFKDWRAPQRFIKPLYRRDNKFYRDDQSEIVRISTGLSERLDGITISDWETRSIKAYGNAIVPQIAFQIFKAIQAYAQPPTYP